MEASRDQNIVVLPLPQVPAEDKIFRLLGCRFQVDVQGLLLRCAMSQQMQLIKQLLKMQNDFSSWAISIDYLLCYAKLLLSIHLSSSPDKVFQQCKMF